MPILWVRIASEGSPPERYALQVPFQLGPTHALQAADTNTITSGSHSLEVVENQGVQLLRISGFATEEEAEAYFQKLRGALLRLAVRRKLSLRSVRSMQTVQIKQPPIEVNEKSNFAGLVHNKGWTHIDGFVDPTPAVVIPEHLRIVEFGAGSLSVQTSMPVQSFLESLVEDLTLQQPEKIAEDERLSLAIDLYAASLWETSQRAQVVGFATSLEALIRPGKVSEPALNLLDRLLALFDSERDPQSENDDQRNELDRLRSRLANLREESISENLRNLATEHANTIGESADEAQRNMVAAYHVRSKLVHDGYAPEDSIKSAAAWLSKAVPAILESLTERASSI